MSFPRRELAALVAAKVRPAGLQCVWADDAAPQLGATGGPAAWVKLTMMGTSSLGEEERSAPHPLNADALVSTIIGQRLYTVSARACSMDRAVQAYDLLEDMRLALCMQAAADFFRLTNTALVRTHPIAVYRTGAGGRTRLEATMDVVFARVLERRIDDDPGNTIATVNGGLGVPITTAGGT